MTKLVINRKIVQPSNSFFLYEKLYEISKVNKSNTLVTLIF